MEMGGDALQRLNSPSSSNKRRAVDPVVEPRHNLSFSFQRGSDPKRSDMVAERDAILKQIILLKQQNLQYFSDL